MTETATIARGLACKHCPAVTRSSLDVARLDGWRTFKGKSVTGKELDDVVCPTCAGTAKPEDGIEKSWRVQCETCDWTSAEGWEPGDDLIVDAKDAKAVADDHRCERRMRIAPPSGDLWFDPDDFDRDGKRRPPTPAPPQAVP